MKQKGKKRLKLVKEFSNCHTRCFAKGILRGFLAGAPSSIGFIKERMLVKVSDVSRIIDRLVKKKMVTRVENPADRRQKSIEITPKGLGLLDKMLGCEKQTDNLHSNLSPDEIRDLNRLLDKARD